MTKTLFEVNRLISRGMMSPGNLFQEPWPCQARPSVAAHPWRLHRPYGEVVTMDRLYWHDANMSEEGFQ